MKKWTVIASALITISFVGCGSAKKETVNVPKPTQTETQAATIKDETIIDYRDFASGVAWVATYDGIWQGIDKNGNIKFTLENNTKPISDFNQGVAIVCDGAQYKGITTENTVTASLPMGDYDDVSYIDNNILYVKKKANTLQGNTIQYGLFDIGNNQWLTPLGELPLENMDHIPCKHIVGDVYLFGDTVLYNTATKSYLSVTDLGKEYGLLDSATPLSDNAFIKMDNGSIGADWIQFDDKNALRQIDVVVLNPMNSENYVESVRLSDFTRTKLEGHPSETRIKVTDDLYCLISNDAGTKTGLYDAKKQLVADLSQYHFKKAEALDDNLLAILENPDGAQFTALIDPTGQLVTEPVEGRYSNTSDGMFYLKDGFYDKSGKEIFSCPPDFGKNSFHDGVLWLPTTKPSGLQQLTLVGKTGETLLDVAYLPNAKATPATPVASAPASETEAKAPTENKYAGIYKSDNGRNMEITTTESGQLESNGNVLEMGNKQDDGGYLLYTEKTPAYTNQLFLYPAGVPLSVYDNSTFKTVASDESKNRLYATFADVPDIHQNVFYQVTFLKDNEVSYSPKQKLLYEFLNEGANATGETKETELFEYVAVGKSDLQEKLVANTTNGVANEIKKAETGNGYYEDATGLYQYRMDAIGGKAYVMLIQYPIKVGAEFQYSSVDGGTGKVDAVGKTLTTAAGILENVVVVTYHYAEGLPGETYYFAPGVGVVKAEGVRSTSELVKISKY